MGYDSPAKVAADIVNSVFLDSKDIFNSNEYDDALLEIILQIEQELENENKFIASLYEEEAIMLSEYSNDSIPCPFCGYV